MHALKNDMLWQTKWIQEDGMKATNEKEEHEKSKTREKQLKIWLQSNIVKKGLLTKQRKDLPCQEIK